ncbi:hypothetical protein BD413DRAFT_613768 [Trametes elegans]|nr:hypothetical protein BD413DRAFT_613768 [Trametes elegans]
MSTVHHTPTHSHAMRFPSIGLEVLSAVIHLFGVSTVAFLLAKKLTWADISSFQAISRISWPRLLVLLTIVDSWLFLFSTGLLVNGLGLEFSETICLLGILNCICFYATSKVFIYLFLVEKVYVVWGGAARKKRLRSHVYLVCLGVVLAYIGVAVFLIIGRVSYFREDGSCVIGLTRPASLTLLIYDLCINIVLTSLFVWPLFNRKFNAPRIRRVATRTLWAAAVALTTSCVNILVLTLMHGKQLGWVCLASCGTDVVINAAVLCWVTSGGSSQGGGSSHSSHDSKMLDENIIDCASASTDSGHGGQPFARRRARSEPPRPTFRVRIGRLSRLFDGRQAHAADVERADGKVDRVVEMIERVDVPRREGAGPAQPVRMYTSMLKRSNPSLHQHLNNSQVQIQVTEETEVLLDELPAPCPKKSKWKHRKQPNYSASETKEGDQS